MFYRKKVLSVDKKRYGKIMDKLVQIYMIVYGMDKDEFIERFYGEDIRAQMFMYYDDALMLKISNLQAINMTEEVRVINKMALYMKWSYTFTLKYLVREIVRGLNYLVRSIEKEKCVDGKWRQIAKEPNFLHPIYDPKLLRNRNKKLKEDETCELY